MFSAIEILDLAIRLEKNSEAVYRNAIQDVTAPDLVSLLVWMADEEVKHLNWFSELKKDIETEVSNPFMEEMGREVFGDLLGDKNFSHQSIDFSRLHRAADLIAVFIEFERDTILFYETLIPFVQDDGTLQNLEKIIAEENNHIEKLQEFLTDETEISLTDE